MSTPKLQAIVSAVAARLPVIDGTGLYHSRLGLSVHRGKRNFNTDELPACSVYLAPRVVDDRQGERSSVDAQIIIEAHAMYGANEPEDVAIQMLADISRAIEIEPYNLGGLLYGTGLTWQGDQIEHPEQDADSVSVQVTYDLPHIRRDGDPDN